jgi:hypothetical protein
MAFVGDAKQATANTGFTTSSHYVLAARKPTCKYHSARNLQRVATVGLRR